MTVTVQHFADYSLAPLRDRDIMPTLTAGLDALDGLHVWVDAGTLLGLWRDGRPMPWDTDIDVAVLDADRDLRAIDGMPLARTVDDHNGRPSQRAFAGPDRIVFDVAFYWTEGDLAICRLDGATLQTPVELVEHLTTWEGLPVPADPDRYLAHRYGDSWRTPSGAKRPWQQDAANIVKESP